MSTASQHRGGVSHPALPTPPVGRTGPVRLRFTVDRVPGNDMCLVTPALVFDRGHGKVGLYALWIFWCVGVEAISA